jgi:hypothetical protein
MLTEFALQVVDRTPDTSKLCTFNDISNEPQELQKYMTLACQLGIMGVDYYGEPDTTFNPNHFFTRDQFVTTLSRMYFGNTYNIVSNELSFFQKGKNFLIHTYNNITRALHINQYISPHLDRYTKHMDIIKQW